MMMMLVEEALTNEKSMNITSKKKNPKPTEYYSKQLIRNFITLQLHCTHTHADFKQFRIQNHKMVNKSTKCNEIYLQCSFFIFDNVIPFDKRKKYGFFRLSEPWYHNIVTIKRLKFFNCLKIERVSMTFLWHYPSDGS